MESSDLLEQDSEDESEDVSEPSDRSCGSSFPSNFECRMCFLLFFRNVFLFLTRLKPY